MQVLDQRSENFAQPGIFGFLERLHHRRGDVFLSFNNHVLVRYG
jgi:hypothetical protein